MNQQYDDFLAGKTKVVENSGIVVAPEDIHPMLFPFQRDLTRWALHKGRCAVFADTGLGKTYVQLQFAHLTKQRTLIIAPLSVARQTVRMARDLQLDVRYVTNDTQTDSEHKLWITNYERIDSFDFTRFGTVVLDESSIIKNIDGKTKKQLIDLCQDIPYRLCCTATPAPNDYIELGNHAQFLGICTMSEMLAMFFINANKEQSFVWNGEIHTKKGTNRGGTEWRLKHHAEQPFFRWLSSWAMTLTSPLDICSCSCHRKEVDT